MSPNQQAFYIQQVVAPVPLKQRTSGFAITSLILGILAIPLALLDLMVDGGTVLEHRHSISDLISLLIIALFCWTPALIALIFGLLAKGKIRQDEGQTKGMGLAYTGITLGSISLALPLIGIILFSITIR